MDKIELLQLLIKESSFPSGLDEDELEAFLEQRNGDVYLTARDLCYLKANQESAITVGPIKIEYPDADFWYTLGDRYAEQSKEMLLASESTETSGYKTSMKRY